SHGLFGRHVDRGGPRTTDPRSGMVPLANSAPIALSFLLQRLKWPVPMSRWRAAREIRSLLGNPATRCATTDMLLGQLEGCKTESEACEILSIVFLTSP